MDGAQYEEVIRVTLQVNDKQLTDAQKRAESVSGQQAGGGRTPTPSPSSVRSPRQQGSEAGVSFAQSALLEFTRGMQRLASGESTYQLRRIFSPFIYPRTGGGGTSPPRYTRPTVGDENSRYGTPSIPRTPSASGVGNPPPRLPGSVTGGSEDNPNLARIGRFSGLALSVSSAIIGVHYWHKAITDTLDTFKKAVTSMADAADKTAKGIVSANSTDILRGMASERLGIAYLNQSRMMYRYGLRGAALGAIPGAVGVGVASGALGAIGGPGGAVMLGGAGAVGGGILGSGIGAAAGVGWGYVKGIADVLKGKVESYLMEKVTSILDSLVDLVKKYNGVAAAWSARYQVEQIRFTMKLGKATEPLIEAWMKLKIRVLEVIENVLPKFKPMIDAASKWIDGLNKQADKLPEIMLGTAAAMLQLAASALDVLDSFKRVIAWVDQHVIHPAGQAASGTANWAVKSAIQLGTPAVSLLQKMGLMGQTNPSGDPSAQATPGSTSTQAAEEGSVVPGGNVQDFLRNIASNLMGFRDDLRKARESDKTKEGSKQQANEPLRRNIMFMQDWAAFDQLHRKSYALLKRYEHEGDTDAIDRLLLRSGPAGLRHARTGGSNSSERSRPLYEPLSHHGAPAIPLSPQNQRIADQVNALSGSATFKNALYNAKVMLNNLRLYGTIDPHPLSDLNAIAKGNQMVGRSNKDVQDLYNRTKALLYPGSVGSESSIPSVDTKAPPWMSYQEWASKRGLKPTARPAVPSGSSVPTPAAKPAASGQYSVAYATDYEYDPSTKLYHVKGGRGSGISATITQEQYNNLAIENMQQQEYARAHPSARSSMSAQSPSKQPPVPTAAGGPTTQPSEKPTTSGKPPAPTPKAVAQQPKPAPMPNPNLFNENNFEFRLENDRMMNDSVMQVRDKLMGAHRKMENEIRLQIALLDGATMGGML